MDQSRAGGEETAHKLEEKKEFKSYVWGIALALILTLIPFASLYWNLMAPGSMSIVIGIFALVQMVVHFRFFLHISFRGKREDLLLILFSTFLLIIMVTGTIWIMSSLATRMALPS